MRQEMFVSEVLDRLGKLQSQHFDINLIHTSVKVTIIESFRRRWIGNHLGCALHVPDHINAHTRGSAIHEQDSQ